MVRGSRLMGQWLLISKVMPNSITRTSRVHVLMPNNAKEYECHHPWEQSCQCLDRSCPPSSLVSPRRVVGCMGGSRYVDGCWGFLYLKKFIGFLILGFLVFSFLSFKLYWFLGFKDYWFLGFKDSWFPRFKDLPDSHFIFLEDIAFTSKMFKIL